MAIFDNFGRTSRGLPQTALDGDQSALRTDRYGGQIVTSLVPTKHALAEEGSYYVATTPTPGTGIAEFSASTAFSDTRGFMVFINRDNPINQGAKRMFIDYVKLILTGTAPATTTVQHFAVKRSTISREPTTAANRTLLTPYNTAGAAGRDSVAKMMSYSVAAAMAIPASNPSDPMVARLSLPTSLGITGDEYILKFGGEDFGAQTGLTAVRATAPARIIAQGPPWVIEPGENHVLHRWWLTETTNFPTYEFEIGWWER